MKLELSSLGQVELNVESSKVFKGIVIKSYIDFNNDLRLIFTTFKNSSGVFFTYAKIVTIEESEFFITEKSSFSDYRSTLETYPQISRGTEKALTKAHLTTVQIRVEDVLESVNKQYGKITLKQKQ